MKNKTIYYNINGEVNRFTTWVNNSIFPWVMLIGLFILASIVESL